MVDPCRPDTGPVWDPYVKYVLACGLRNLRQVSVGGKLVSKKGRLVDAGADEVSTQVYERLGRIRRDVDGPG